MLPPGRREQVALRGELLVGLHDDASCHAELERQRPCRGQRRSRPQAARPDGVAQLLLELLMERLIVLALERQEELDR